MIFARYIGIDYSGAQTPTASLKGLRIYSTEGEAAPVEVLPPPSPRKYWTRKGVAHQLIERLAEDAATLVGIDHGFSRIALNRTGPPSSTIFSGIGRLTKTTPTSILSATAQ